MASWVGWEQDVLAAGGWPVTPSNVRFLSEWHPYELSNCNNNPLNTTLVTSTSTRCNSAGVQNYPTTAAGARATANTLKGAFYPNIQAALSQGDPYLYAGSIAVSEEITTWGTPNYAAHYLQQVTGTTGPPLGGSIPTGGSGTGSAQSSVQVEQAWTRLMHYLAVTAPRHLSTVAASRSRIRKAVR